VTCGAKSANRSCADGVSLSQANVGVSSIGLGLGLAEIPGRPAHYNILTAIAQVTHCHIPCIVILTIMFLAVAFLQSCNL
jgi:hypothetical protein